MQNLSTGSLIEFNEAAYSSEILLSFELSTDVGYFLE